VESKKNMRSKGFLAFLLLIFLFGCSNQVATPALPLPTPVVISSETPTPSPSPSLTLPDTPSPAHTATALPTPTLNSTQAMKATQQMAVEQNCDGRYDPISFGSLLSKLGKFTAFVCWPLNDKDLSTTKVVALDGSRAPIDISYRKDYLGIDYSQPVPQSVQDEQRDWPERYALYPVRWTADDKFLYLHAPTPYSGLLYYPVIFALMRLNIETGSLTPVLSRTKYYYYYNFSADGTKLLYVDWGKNPLVIKVASLVSGEEIKVPLDERFVTAGDLMLSPDGTKLVISATNGEAAISMIVTDLLSGSQEYLAKDKTFDFFPVSWLDDHTIYGISSENESEPYFYLDIVTRRISPAPTPTHIP
jgi:hypothetical protein